MKRYNGLHTQDIRYLLLSGVAKFLCSDFRKTYKLWSQDNVYVLECPISEVPLDAPITKTSQLFHLLPCVQRKGPQSKSDQIITAQPHRSEPRCCKASCPKHLLTEPILPCSEMYSSCCCVCCVPDMSQLQAWSISFSVNGRFFLRG